MVILQVARDGGDPSSYEYDGYVDHKFRWEFRKAGIFEATELVLSGYQKGISIFYLLWKPKLRHAERHTE